jgi:trimethylamine:corrinoid methyltransferase-like protein
MREARERGGLGEPRAGAERILLVLIAAVIVVNLWSFAGHQQTDRRLRVRRAVGVESIAARTKSQAVRYRHGTYYRLARELDGAALHMDERMAELHRWALEALGDIEVRTAPAAVHIAKKRAGPIAAAASYTTRLDGRRLDVLLDPADREYVMAWVGRGEQARVLVLPLARFRAAGGSL